MKLDDLERLAELVSRHAASDPDAHRLLKEVYRERMRQILANARRAGRRRHARGSA